MNDTDEIPEELSEENVRPWGIDDRKTTQHVMKAIELLNSWNRQSDALAFLAHSKDVLDRIQGENEETNRLGGAGSSRTRIFSDRPSFKSRNGTLRAITRDILENPSKATIDHGIGLARAYTSIDEATSEVFFETAETVCARSGFDLAVQGLRARAERFNYYHNLQSTRQHLEAYNNAKNLLSGFWEGFPWDCEKIWSLDLLEASMELASALLKVGLTTDSTWMFREVEKKATKVFGWGDERTIWTLITIGIVHQNYRFWKAAKPWFEQALSALLSAYDDGDGITKSLETALEKRHFSYITDEGRPFKTMFGVCVITIRPNGLHLE